MKRTIVKSVETRYYEEREALFRGLKNLDRRSFLKLSAVAAAAALARGVEFNFHSFQPVQVAHAATGEAGPVEFTFAYISDSHLYKRELNDRFVRQLLRAVDDINHMAPQPDFVLYGGDLAQLGQPLELELGAQILKSLKAPVKMMVGEHDWFLDMGEKWRTLFGEPTYSFDHKGVHFVVLHSVMEDDFWSERGMTGMERMQTVAGLDNGIQSRFKVGTEQQAWLKNDLAAYSDATPLIVFSHSPLYKYYRPWNFWTEDAEEVQALIAAFQASGGRARAYPPDPYPSDRQHPFPWDAVHRLAVALCARGVAGPHGADEPCRSLQSQRRARGWIGRRQSGWPRR